MTQQDSQYIKELVDYVNLITGNERPTYNSLHYMLLDYDGNKAANWAPAVAKKL